MEFVEKWLDLDPDKNVLSTKVYQQTIELSKNELLKKVEHADAIHTVGERITMYYLEGNTRKWISIKNREFVQWSTKRIKYTIFDCIDYIYAQPTVEQDPLEE